MDKIKIIALTNDNGVSYHRVIKPLQKLVALYPDEFEVTFMGVKDTDVSKLPDLRTYKFDIIYFNTILGIDDDNKLLGYLEACLLRGAKIVLDIDDNYKFGRSVMVKKDVGQKHAELVPEALRSADYVTTTTETYAKELRLLNPNVTVFPNFADKGDEQYVVKKTPQRLNVNGDKIIRVGVTGSVMHKYDLQLLNNVSLRLKKDGLINRFQFVLCGYADNVYYHEYEKILTSDYRIVSRKYRHMLENTRLNNISMEDEPYKRVAWKPFTEYMTIYNNLDVLLAPLENSKFNEAKSQIKFIEAGWMDTLFIGSNVVSYNPYVKHGYNGFLCDNQDDFYKALKHVGIFWDAYDGFREIRDEARMCIAENYEAEAITTDRRNFFNSIL